MKLKSALFLLVVLGVSLASAQNARSQGLAASPDESINIDDAESPIADFSGQDDEVSDDEDTPKVASVATSTPPPPKRTHLDAVEEGSGVPSGVDQDGEDGDGEENGNDFEEQPIDQLAPEKQPVDTESREDISEDRTSTSTSSTKTPPSEIKGPAPNNREVSMQPANRQNKLLGITSHPGILAGIIGGAVVGLLCAILLIMFIVYRMRKKDEGSYALDEPKRASPAHRYGYSPAPTKEFYA